MSSYKKVFEDKAALTKEEQIEVDRLNKYIYKYDLLPILQKKG